MFSSDKEVERLKKRIEELEERVTNRNERIREVEFRNSCQQREYDLEKKKVVFETTESMRSDLIEADAKRIRAESSLSAYKDMDNKDERKKILGMLETAVENLSKQGVNVIK